MTVPRLVQLRNASMLTTNEFWAVNTTAERAEPTSACTLPRSVSSAQRSIAEWEHRTSTASCVQPSAVARAAASQNPTAASAGSASLMAASCGASAEGASAARLRASQRARPCVAWTHSLRAAGLDSEQELGASAAWLR